MNSLAGRSNFDVTRSRDRIGFSVVSLVLASFLVVLFRVFCPERPLEYTGVQAICNAIFTLWLVGLLGLIAAAAGARITGWLKLGELSLLDKLVFRLALGAGLLAYGVFFLGLLGFLYPFPLLVWVIILGIWARRELVVTIKSGFGWLSGIRTSLTTLGNWQRFLLLIGSVIMALSLLQALSPPWDADGLMYHLQGPRLFLDAGRLLPLPDVWGANGPFTVEMLFTLGMAFQSDTAAKVIHFSFALLLICATFAFGQRHLQPNGGWIAAAILIGIPIYPIWASLAYIDFAWALFEFLGFVAILRWQKQHNRSWLLVAGLMAGLALGSKYLGLGGVVVIGGWVVWISFRMSPRSTIQNVVIFGATALGVGSPWYVKNWLWVGNPVYPLYFGGLEWPNDRVQLLMTYLRSFGTGHSILDYLLLPWNLYAQFERYTTFLGSLEIPSLIFPIVLIYPWTKRSRTLDGLFVMTALRLGLWALGSHQTRFLLPTFPGLGLLSAAVIMALSQKSRLYRYTRILSTGLLGGFVVTTLVYSVLFLVDVNPHSVVFGLESKDAFLRRVLKDYAGKRYIQEHISPENKVLLMWNGQGYYCDERCLPDTEHHRWTRLVAQDPEPVAVVKELNRQGITHLLFSISDVDFILQHDPTGVHRMGVDFFLYDFRDTCAREIYRDNGVSLYETSCGS